RHESNQDLGGVIASIANSRGELKFVLVSGQDAGGVRAPGHVFARELGQLLRRVPLPISLKYAHVHSRAPSTNQRNYASPVTIKLQADAVKQVPRIQLLCVGSHG